MSVFKNDPFELVYSVFKKLYPGKDVNDIEWVDIPIKNNQCGFTDFMEDGSIRICINGNLSILNAVEILAHELAHVAVGVKHSHDEIWEQAFEAIHTEYMKGASNE